MLEQRRDNCLCIAILPIFMLRHQQLMMTVLVAGRLYAVFGKRQGRIVSTESAYGFGGQFRVLATLPVLESFHLARELRTQTSGLASPQLVFSHWEVSAFSCELKCSQI